jgi:hypothetical protein
MQVKYGQSHRKLHEIHERLINKYVNLLVFVRLYRYSQVQNFLPSQSFKARAVLIK